VRAPGPSIETQRLILRPVAAEDFDALAAMSADQLVMEFLGGPQPRSVAWRSFLNMAGAWTLQGFGMFSVVERETGRWVGRIGPHRPEGWPGNEVGWALIRDAWGKGYAVEAASASMDFAVDVLGWTDIIHCIADENGPSQRVAQSLGSSFRGVGRMPAPVDEDIGLWGQTAEQWRARRASLQNQPAVRSTLA
jgi:RimJ/RimL family protein N-acetyltransferase